LRNKPSRKGLKRYKNALRFYNSGKPGPALRAGRAQAVNELDI
jgi:hypothetical protein